MLRHLTFQRMAMGLLLCIALTSAVSLPENKADAVASPVATAPLTVDQVLSMDARAFSDVTGHRMGLKERLAFRIAQRSLREELGKNEMRGDTPVDLEKMMADGEKGFRFGGFVLGLFLGLIGVLIAYLLKRDKGFIRSVWIGWGVWVAIVIAVVAAAAGTA